MGASAGQDSMAQGDEATSKFIWLDSNAQLHLATSDPWHWDAARGVQDLTLGDEMEPVDMNGDIWMVTDSAGGSYLVWQGDSPVDDGLDMYAAFVSPELPNLIFLPITVRP